jgi:hypothetical protein
MITLNAAAGLLGQLEGLAAMLGGELGQLRERPAYYFLDQQRQIAPTTPARHRRFMRQVEKRRVATSWVRGVRISTMFLGYAGVFFETQVFGGTLDSATLHADDWQLAQVMHAVMIAQVRRYDSPMRRKIRRMIREY